MLLTLLVKPAAILYLLMTLLFFFLQAVSPSGGTYLIETAFTNGSIGGVLLFIWYLTFRSTQRQFEFALKQNQAQFEKALLQIENQHKDNLAFNQRMIDKIFELMSKDAEYKEILTGVLTEMKDTLTSHCEDHRKEVRR